MSSPNSHTGVVIMNTSCVRWLTVMIIFVALPESAGAAEVCGNVVGKFVSIEGAIEVNHGNLGEWQPVTTEISLCQDDMIHAGENSRATVSLINDVVLRLDQNTTMRLVDVAPQPEKRSLLQLVMGAFKSFSRPPRTLAVNTPYVNGLIEGTEFAMRVDKESTWVSVYEGKVSAVNDHGKLSLKRGESALTKAGKAPQPYTLIKPSDAVQWTLHFPPLLAVLGGGRQIPPGVSSIVGKALALAGNGDTPSALALLKQVPDSEQSADYFLYRSALYLDVGKAAEAQSDITSSLTKNPASGLAYALRAIIEITNNQRPQALASAEKAVALAPNSSAVKIALSYAQQADFHLEAARDTLLSAVSANPNDALAWARLGELWLMFGERSKALDAAHKAETLAPGLARTQSVLGFTALAENREADAKTAFERAIKLDSADPLAHFGLGLTKIKRGDLKAGRKEIESAVAIDSSNALLRSYLGKAYYEEKRYPLEGHQYSIAKELDPADPTPYLYSAIDNQTTNRPVEALHDMQKAIDLNDNRAVYRSRQLLDSDLAARSASLARVYTDLGFQQRALVEGWKSVNTDPGNFSAHRFLADSYSALPRHEIARVSELLQSQLLQPLSMTPIQPRLAESNLFLISAGGPGALSFNEFNPIFNRNGLNFQTSGMVGENNTYAGEGVLSGIYKNAAFSFGGFHFTSDGFRPNADQKDDIGNAFFQVELTPETSIQAEYRYRNAERGDLQLKFFPDEYYPGQRTPQETNTFRLGGRHAFSPNSTVLGSFIYTNANFNISDKQPFIAPGFVNFYNIEEPQEALSGEVQHIFRSQYVTLTSGVGHFDRNSTEDFTIRTVFPPPDDVIAFPTLDTDLRHTNVYTYSNIRPLDNLTLTVGLSGEFSDSDNESVANSNRLNPKFGFLWSPLKNTLMRFAAFKTSKRPIITNQTLEPTQVAGFNQFYDDYNDTTAWRYGTAVDQIFTKNLYGGIELSRRDQNVPASDQFGTPIRADWQDNLARTYLFWAPHPWVALKAEYQYERIKRDEELTDGVKESTTHRVPLGVNFFHPSGVSASIKTTYFNQDGIFESIKTGELQPGQDNFWIVDAAISYRLPKRYGFISVGATNLLDEAFNYFDTDFNNPSISPDRMVYGRVTLAVP